MIYGVKPGATDASRTADAAASAVREDERLRHTAQEFEGLLLAHLLKTMRGRPAERGLFAPSESERLWREMHDEEMGRAVARQGGIGLAQLLVDALRSRRAEAR